MRKLIILSLVLTLTVLGAGCKEEPPPPPKEEKEPEPTPQEIYNQIKGKLGAYYQAFQQKGAIPQDTEQAVSALKSAKMTHTATENGRQALSMVQRDIEKMVKWARDEERYRWVKEAIKLYKVLEPGSERYKSLERRADLMLARPKVSVKGFFELNGDLYAFLQTTDPESGEVNQHKIREGEEFAEVLRLIRIIGDSQAVELLYIPANDTWVVKGPNQ